MFALEDVGFDDAEIWRVLEGELGEGGEASIEFDGDDGGGGLDESGGEGSCAAADFEDDVGWIDVGFADDEVVDIEIDEEVLTELVAWRDASFGEEVSEVGLGLARVVHFFGEGSLGDDDEGLCGGGG
jgi:hypothetical protein